MFDQLEEDCCGCFRTARTEEIVACALRTTYSGDYYEDVDALGQLVHDEYGCPNALFEAGQLFESVSVPDDVGFDEDAEYGPYCNGCKPGCPYGR